MATTTSTPHERTQARPAAERAVVDEQVRTGAQILWEVLVEEGVDVVFGYPGGAIMPAYDALLGYPQLHHVLVRHEQGAAHMADGYARASGRVGVCVATSGPGATNLVTGIATAMLDSSPMVCITGQVASKLLGSDAFQETDITGVTLPITKHNYLVTDIHQLASSLHEAFHIARSGRPGPVLVDITKDVQQASIPYSPCSSPCPQSKARPVRELTPDALKQAIELIDRAERPLILAGQGILKADACRELIAFAEKAGIPVALTLLGLGGFPAKHPLCLGMMGMHGEAWVNTAIQQADLLIALGMRFDDRVTGNLQTYARNATKIHIDIDPSEINKNVRVDVGIVADVRASMQSLEKSVQPSARKRWNEHLTALKGDSAVRDIQSLPHNGRLFAAHVIHDIWKLTEGRAVVVTDVGQHQMWEAQYYKHDYPRKLITSGGLGTMGFALPAAIGAWFATHDRETREYAREVAGAQLLRSMSFGAAPNLVARSNGSPSVPPPASATDPNEVWVVAGDGGFQMTACELATCAQEGAKVIVAIINNGYLGMVRQWQQFFYDGRYSNTPLHSPDFVKLAEAHGLTGLRVDRREDLAAAVAKARAAKGSVVIDFRVEQEDSVYPMVPTGADLDKMIRRPSAIVETPQEDAVHDPMRVLPEVALPKVHAPPEVPVERTILAYVEDRPGVLNRVASLFRRRAYNIVSLTVGRTHIEGLSRLTLVTVAGDDAARRLEANLYKLVEVLWVRDITHDAMVESDLALVKVGVSDDTRADVMKLCRHHGCRAIDVTKSAVILEVTGDRERLDIILDALRPFGIVDTVRTGMIAMARGDAGEPAVSELLPSS